MIILHPPDHIETVLRVLEDAGFEAYLVGGGVRDSVLGRQPTDWDVATSALVQETASLFPKTALTGARYGTVTVILPECSVEVTTFRTDGEYLDGRRPETVRFVGELSGDLSRRDFTINAMAISRAGELIDLFGGVQDIEARLIRCVGDPERRFGEDALRMLRALRFSAELGFAVEPETKRAIAHLAPSARLLSAERVQVEVWKTLLSERPEITGDMIKYGLLDLYMNDSGKKDLDFSKIKDLPRDTPLRWCVFCAILKHAGLVDSPLGFARAMRLDKKTAELCTVGTELALKGVPPDDTGIKRLLAGHEEDAVRCAAAAHEVLYDEPRLDAVGAVIRGGECYSVKNLAITGRDLIDAGIPKGREIGMRLEALLEHVIEHPEDNNSEKLLELLTGNC